MKPSLQDTIKKGMLSFLTASLLICSGAAACMAETPSGSYWGEEDTITYTVTLELGDEFTNSYYRNQYDEKEKTVDADSVLGDFLPPEYVVKYGVDSGFSGRYNFAGWFDRNDTGFEHPITSETVIRSDLHITAHWVPRPAWQYNEIQDTVTIPEGTRTIEEEAFSGITAEIIVLPDECLVIGHRAFADCPNLKYIEAKSPAAIDIAEDALEGTDAVIVVKQ